MKFMCFLGLSFLINQKLFSVGFQLLVRFLGSFYKVPWGLLYLLRKARLYTLPRFPG